MNQKTNTSVNTLKSVPKGVSVLFVGDVHEHSKQFQELISAFQPSDKRWVVSLGDVYDKGFGVEAAEEVTDELINLESKSIGFAVKGNHELKVIRKNRKNLTDQLKWWRARSLFLTFDFHNGSRVTALHAGVTPQMSHDSLNSIEVAYVRDVDEEGMIPLVWKDTPEGKVLVKSREGGNNWHEVYDGRFGYIVSGHAAQKDGEAKFFNFSANLDSAVYETGKLTGQVFEAGKLVEKIVVEGEAAKPELNDKF